MPGLGRRDAVPAWYGFTLSNGCLLIMESQEIFGASIAGATVFASLWCFGHFLDKKIRDTCRTPPYRLITNATSIEWADNFLLLYDALFGSAEKRRPMFWRVVLISCASMAIMMVDWIILRPSSSFEILVLPITAVMLAYAIPLNIAADYLSLWKTRLFVAYVVQHQSKAVHNVLLVSDGVASAAIFIVGLGLGTIPLAMVLASGLGRTDWVSAGFGEFVSVASKIFLEGAWSFSHSKESVNLLGMFFFTTFLGSVWLWTYRIGIVFFSFPSRVRDVLKVEEYPVVAPMATGGAFLGIVTATVAIWL